MPDLPPLNLTRLPAVQARQRLQGFVNEARMIGPLPEGSVTAAIIRRMPPEHVGIAFLTFDDLWPQEAPQPQPGQLAAGDMLHAGAAAVFGRHHEGCLRVVEVGDDWIVARPLIRDRDGAIDWEVPVFSYGSDVIETAVANRDAGVQPRCRTSFDDGCAYRIGYKPDF